MPLVSLFRQMYLRRLIVLLLALAVLITLAGGLSAGHWVFQRVLVSNALEANRVYAAKIAATVSLEVDTAHQLLAASATRLSRHWDENTWDEEAERLKTQSEIFNSVIVVRNDATLMANTPLRRNMLHRRMTTLGSVEALRLRKPLVSPPFHAHSGHFIVLVSQPVWSPQGQYLGFVAGTIYLDSVNTLGRLIAQHFYHDGSYIYAVDQRGTIIYHQDARRVGDNVARNPMVSQVTRGRAGASEVVNTQGQAMLAGYAPISNLGWGVVSQQPASVVLAQVHQLTYTLFLYSMPFFLLAMVGGWLLARHIAQPLHQLADISSGLDDPGAPERLHLIRDWYKEARLIKHGLMTGLRSLQLQLKFLYQESTTDPLTGLTNRRGAQRQLDAWKVSHLPFAVLALDVDHFKAINDRFGHQTGDQVLKHLAGLMDKACRENDLTCRTGGEEFLILLPNCPLTRAREVAERLRQTIEETPNPTGNPVTISIGIAHHPTQGQTADETISLADKALYLAKQRGRNRVETA